MLSATDRRSDRARPERGRGRGAGSRPAPGLTTTTDAAPAPLDGDYLVFARFAAANSQFTSLSKNTCTYPGRRFW